MADVGSLGEYKVVVTADYSQLKSQFEAMSSLVSETAKNISSTLNNTAKSVNKNMVNEFTNMGISISKIMGKSLDDTVKTTERQLTKLKTKYDEFYKSFPQAPKIPAPAIPAPPKVGGSSGAGGFSEYAARIREAERAFDRLREKEKKRAYDRFFRAREDAEIAERTAQHRAFWEAPILAEQRAERQRQANWVQQQRRIRQLMTQYNIAYAEVNKYLQSHAKMSEAVFIRLQSKLQSIRSQLINDLHTTPLMRNPLEGLSYSDYEKRFSKFADMAKSLKHHLTWMASAAAIGATIGIPTKMVSTIADVEKQMASMRQVNHAVDSDQKVLNQTMNDFIGIAQKYGHSVDDIIKAGTLWGRGYKDLNTVMELTNLSAKLAVADNMNVDLANRAVESVINGYQMQGDAVNFATHVVDSWTKVAHNAQSSATDLAEALMRTGAAAKAVGVNFDTTTAMASAMIKATGRSGAEVGNALKSLFSSIHNDKAIKQLKELGIEMYKVEADGTKHFRKLHDVFIDLMITSHTTYRNMEKDLLAISGGKFQWSKVASLLGSYEDFIHAYGLSIKSSGFADEQVGAQLDTISRKFEQLKATMTGIATGIGASGLTNYIKNIISSLNAFAQAIQRIPTSTYEMIGSIVKWISVGLGSIAVLRQIIKAIILLQGAKKIFVRTQLAETIATKANTLANVKNLAMRVLGINSARAQVGANMAAAVSTDVLTAAEGRSAVATGAWAAAMTAATGGVNLLMAAVITAVLGFLGYNTMMSTAIEETDKFAQKQEDTVTALEQNVHNLEAQKDFVTTLCESHAKLQEALENTKEGTEQHTKAEKDLQATDNELTEVLRDNAIDKIDWSKGVQEVIKEEQDTFDKKIADEKKKLAEAKLAQVKYTENQIAWTKNRIAALKDEGYGWNALKEVIEKFVRFLGGALVMIGENLRNLQDSIRETPILGNIAKMTGFGEIGSGSRNMLNDLIAKGHSMQSYSGQSIIDSLKSMPVIGDVGQYMIDHFYGFHGIGGSHSNRESELQYQQESLTKLEQDLIDKKTKYYRQRAENWNNDNDSGEVPDSDKKGKKERTPKGAKEADNSIEAMLYRHMTKTLKLSHAQAIGELANIQQESGFNYKADNGTHKGLYQMDSTRWARYQDWLTKTGRTDSAVSQVDFRNLFESKFVEYEARQQQKYLLSGATTPREYAAAFNEFIERSGEKAGSIGYENRMRYADTLDKRFARKNGEENFDDVLGAREDAYKRLYEQFDDEIERLKTERAKIGQDISADEKVKIFEKIMGIGEGKENYIFAEVVKAQKDYAKLLLESAKEEAKRKDSIKKSADMQVQAVEKMADAEVAFAEKLGLLNKSDVRKYNYEKNERNYATNKPLLDAKLGATVDMSKGTADDMLKAYQNFVYAKNDLEAKMYAERIFWLSRDVEATSKALNEEFKLEESYQNKRRELNEETFLYKNRYALKFVDSLSSAIQSGLEGILNRTKTFAEAFKDIFKQVVNDIIKLFSEDFANRIKKWLTNAIFKRKETGNKAGSFVDLDSVYGGGKKGGSGTFDLVGWAKDTLSLGGKGFGGKGGGKNVLAQAMGLYSFPSEVKRIVQPALYSLKGQVNMTVNGISNLSKQGMDTIYTGIESGTQAISMNWQTMETTKQVATETGNTAIVANSQATAATVQATTMTMIGWLMAVLALFSLFGGRGGGSSTSTSSENLGRSPDSYYMTPTPVLQSTTYQVPSFDTGGNIEEDMFAFVHKNEMILTPEQADVIRNTARYGGNIGGNNGANANIKSSISVSTVDSKGFDRVLHNYNRDLSKNIKNGIRNGYLTANGLV